MRKFVFRLLSPPTFLIFRWEGQDSDVGHADDWPVSSSLLTDMEMKRLSWKNIKSPSNQTAITSPKSHQCSRFFHIAAMPQGPVKVESAWRRPRCRRSLATGDTHGLEFPHFSTRRQPGGEGAKRMEIGTRHSGFPAGRKSAANWYDSSYR